MYQLDSEIAQWVQVAWSGGWVQGTPRHLHQVHLVEGCCEKPKDRTSSIESSTPTIAQLVRSLGVLCLWYLSIGRLSEGMMVGDYLEVTSPVEGVSG